MAFLCDYIQRLCEAAFPGYMNTPLEITLFVSFCYLLKWPDSFLFFYFLVALLVTAEV